MRSMISRIKIPVSLALGVIFSLRSYAQSYLSVSPAPKVPELSQKLSDFDVKQADEAKKLVNYWNQTTGKHFEVVTHAEDNSVDLKCFDCNISDFVTGEELLLPKNVNGEP